MHSGFLFLGLVFLYVSGFCMRGSQEFTEQKERKLAEDRKKEKCQGRQNDRRNGRKHREGRRKGSANTNKEERKRSSLRIHRREEAGKTVKAGIRNKTRKKRI